jgi:hypothetical protein
MKTCSICELEKDLLEFGKDSGSKDGLRRYCKACGQGYWRKWRAIPENAARVNAAQKRRHSENPDIYRKRTEECRLKKSFGISLAKKKEMILDQENKCAICGVEFTRPFLANVDHIHGSSPVIVRGILCPCCNTGLGQFKDSVDFLLNAVAYLRKFQS